MPNILETHSLCLESEIILHDSQQELAINVKNSDGFSALHLAAEEGLVASIEQLLDAGADIELKTTSGFSALHLAIQHKKSAVIDCLLARGANINAQTACGSTVLDLVFELKDISCMDYILGKNPDINFEKDGELTKLCINVTENDKPIIDHLLTKEADFRLKDILFMDYLIEKKADINLLNNKGLSLLHRAVELDDIMMIGYLLLRGADINARTAQGLSVLDLAVQQSTTDYLLKKGATIDLINHPEPCVPTLAESNNGDVDNSLSPFAQQPCYKEVVEQLSTEFYYFDDNPQINPLDNTKQINIQSSLLTTHDSLLGRLISYQQITNPSNVCLMPTRLSFFQSQHARPDFLQYAKNGQVGHVFDCLCRNIDIDTLDNQGYTALLLAAKYGHIYMVNLLLNKKANVNHANHYGHTALHLAASSGYFEIIEMLIRFGADVHKVDNQYKTSLDIAIEFNHRHIIELLENQPPPAKKAKH